MHVREDLGERDGQRASTCPDVKQPGTRRGQAAGQVVHHRQREPGHGRRPLRARAPLGQNGLVALGAPLITAATSQCRSFVQGGRGLAGDLPRVSRCQVRAAAFPARW